jgi:CheY-like chemotaxis protein
MPEMSGFEFAEHFRRLPHCRGTPVIIWTMRDVSRDEYERLRLSVQTIVEKGDSGGAAVVSELRRTLGLEETA